MKCEMYIQTLALLEKTFQKRERFIQKC